MHSEESCHKLPGTLHLRRDGMGESTGNLNTDAVSIIRIPADGQVMYQNQAPGIRVIHPIYLDFHLSAVCASVLITQLVLTS